jgi:hypothetical protein
MENLWSLDGGGVPLMNNGRPVGGSKGCIAAHLMSLRAAYRIPEGRIQREAGVVVIRVSPYMLSPERARSLTIGALHAMFHLNRSTSE